MLSEERGLIDVIAKGARKGGSRLAGCSEPLAVCEMHVAKGKARDFVTQAQPITSFPGYRVDYDRLLCGLAFAEIVAAVTPHERADTELFTFVLVALKQIESHTKPIVATAWAEVLLLQVIGSVPSFDRCVETGAKIQEADAYFSPAAGGYVVQEVALPLADKIKTRAEVLVGLAKLGELSEPPQSLKLADESLQLLHKIWIELAGRALPAHAQLLEAIHPVNSAAR